MKNEDCDCSPSLKLNQYDTELLFIADRSVAVHQSIITQSDTPQNCTDTDCDQVFIRPISQCDIQ